MKVLVVFVKEDKGKFSLLKDKFSSLGIDASPMEISEFLNIEVCEIISRHQHFLMLNNTKLANSKPYLFLSGFCLGKNCSAVLYGEGVGEEFAEIGYWLPVKNLVSFNSYYSTEKERWDRDQAIINARRQLKEKGYHFTTDAMALAVNEEDVDAVNLFLSAEFSPDSRDSRGTPLLSLAARRGNTEILTILHEAGAPLDTVSRDRENTALMDAAAEGKTEVVKILIDAGAGLEFKSKNGQTALILAVGQRHVDTARVLISTGADPEVRDKLGMTVTGYAKLFKLEELETLLDEITS